ncbi:MAG: acyltransferase [Bacteroidetes bacterium]|nr:acyltransferase [Bacteroidota bacterium]
MIQSSHNPHNPVIKEESNQQRIFGLDLFRALSIVAVFLSHSIDLNPLKKEFPYFAWLGFGVEAFFVLSGFLIGRIILQTFFQKAITWEVIASFWINRWFRTIPAYLFTLFIYFLFFPHFGLKIISYLFFLQNAITPIPYLFPHSWSLSVEEWFYFSFPIIIWVTYILQKKTQHPYKIFIFSSLTLIFIGFMCRTVLYFIANHTSIIHTAIKQGYLFPSWGTFLTPYYWDTMRKMTFFRIDSIAFGCIIAYVFETNKELLLKNHIKLFITGLLLLFLSYFLFVKNVINGKPNVISDIILLPIFSLSFSFLIPTFISTPVPNKNRIFKITHTISLTSYSFYLIHLLVIDLFFQNFNTQNTSCLKTTITFATCYLATFLLSYLMYNYIEKPFLSYRTTINKKIFSKNKK